MDMIPPPGHERYDPDGSQDTSHIETYPWRRYFAKQLDMTWNTLLSMLMASLVMLAFCAVPIFILGVMGDGLGEEDIEELVGDTALFVGLFFLLLWGFFVIFFEAICLALFGTTPGRLLFGIKVRDKDGNKPTFKQAFKRSTLLIILGLGCLIPCFTLVTIILGYYNLTRKKITVWDKSAGLEVHHMEWSLMRRLTCIIVSILNFALIILLHISLG